MSEGSQLFLSAIGPATWRSGVAERASGRPPTSISGWSRGRSMSQAIVDPIELRRFAQNLKKFNTGVGRAAYLAAGPASWARRHLA